MSFFSIAFKKNQTGPDPTKWVGLATELGLGQEQVQTNNTRKGKKRCYNVHVLHVNSVE